MRLGELLLSEKLITPEGLEEALESQVVHGGRLGTNLVELGLLGEKDLARVLGKQLNCAFASGEMVPDPKALELVEADYADQMDVLPMRVDATRLSVAVINPHDFKTLDAIAFKTGKRVVPVVIPEFRMSQLLRRYCRAWRQPRAIDMNTIRPSKTLGTLKEDEKRGGAAGPDLMSEDEFASLYAQALSGGREDKLDAAVAEPVAPAHVPPAAAPRPSGGFPIAPPAPQAPMAAAPQPMAPPPQAAPPRAPPQQPPAPTTWQPPPPSEQPPTTWMPAPPAPAAPRPAAPMAAAAPPPAQVVAIPEPPPTPLTFPQAQQMLSQSSDRNDIGRTVLRFALGKWKRTLLLSVQGNLVTGWQGLGQGIRMQAIQRIGIGLTGQSTFKLVRDLRSHYVGPIKRDAGTAVFYKLLGGGYPTTAVMLPLLVRGKVVHILYVDNGPDQLTPPDVGELLILSQSVTRSYETLMKRRKSA
ncbi:MAG TPA: hypothetical protein VK420_06545 [Longimicrobium sp.]|nr:hypothetical protein [Longimicrobium sp.]